MCDGSERLKAGCGHGGLVIINPRPFVKATAGLLEFSCGPAD